jgi:predicted DNA binding CopG/RHH family protein
MRCAKLKTMGSVASSMQHNFREQKTPNADAERTPQNEHLGASTTTEAMELLRENLPEKRRKDAVVAIEYLFTTSPEWAESAPEGAQKAFFAKSMQWLQNKYGASNVLVATIQRDETTPHLSAFVTPITSDGRLSAKEFIGNRTKMSQDQTTFAEAVKDIGLQRGVKGSKSKHQSIRKYYENVNRADKAHIKPDKLQDIKDDLTPQVVSKSFLSRTEEAPEAIAQRIMSKYLKPLAQKIASLSLELKNEKKRTTHLNKKAAEVPANLSQDDVKRLLNLASTTKLNRQRTIREKQQKNYSL